VNVNYGFKNYLWWKIEELIGDGTKISMIYMQFPISDIYKNMQRWGYAL